MHKGDSEGSFAATEKVVAVEMRLESRQMERPYRAGEAGISRIAR